MGGVVRGIGRAIGGVARGIGSTVGGVVKGAGQILSGHPIKGLGTIAKGVVQGAGHVIKGGLGAVKEVLGDPIVGVLGGAAAGFLIGGPIGAVLGGVFGPAIGKAGASVFGALENGVGNLFGINKPAQGVGSQENAYAFGPFNGHGSYYPGGGFYPQVMPGGSPMQMGGMPMGPGMDPMTLFMAGMMLGRMMSQGGQAPAYPPQMGQCCRCQCQFSC